MPLPMRLMLYSCCGFQLCLTHVGAHSVDIRNALKGHPMAAEMADVIGPEPEPEPEPEAPKGEAKEEAKEAPKGLPSLGKPAKKKEEAKA